MNQPAHQLKQPGWALALGLATLALLPAWDSVVSLPAQDRGWEALAWPAAVTALLTAGLVVVYRWRGHAARLLLQLPLVLLLGLLLIDTAAFLVATLRALVEVQAGARYGMVRNGIMTLAAVAAAAWVVRGWRQGWRRPVQDATAVVSVLCALPAVFVASYLLGLASLQAAPSAAPSKAPAKHTTVVLIFDELDDTVMSKRIESLPNFRRLREHALIAKAMYPAANYTTESLPAMLTGKDYAYTSYSRDEIHVQPADRTTWQAMSKMPSLLSDAVGRGERVDVVGWHLPYCSVFKSLQSCWDDAAWRAPGRAVWLPVWMLGHSRLWARLEQHWLDTRHRGMGGNMREYSRVFFAAPSNYRLRRIGEIYTAQAAAVRQLVTQGRSELIFAHLACPHPPSLTATEVDSQDAFKAYDNNLVQCDRLLGEVLQGLQGRAPATGWSLVVTSDHWFRGHDWLEAGRPLAVPSQRQTVPFLVLLDSGPATGQATFQIATTRVLRKLTTTLATGTATYEQVRALIDAQGDGPTRLRSF